MNGWHQNATKSTSSSVLLYAMEVEEARTAPKCHKSTSGPLLHTRKAATATKLRHLHSLLDAREVVEVDRWAQPMVSPSLGRYCPHWVGFTVVGLNSLLLSWIHCRWGSYRRRWVVFAAVGPPPAAVVLVLRPWLISCSTPSLANRACWATKFAGLWAVCIRFESPLLIVDWVVCVVVGFESFSSGCIHPHRPLVVVSLLLWHVIAVLLVFFICA